MKKNNRDRTEAVVSLNQLEVMQLEMILNEEDAGEALVFLRDNIYAKFKEGKRSREIHQRMVDTQTEWREGLFEDDPFSGQKKEKE